MFHSNDNKFRINWRSLSSEQKENEVERLQRSWCERRTQVSHLAMIQWPAMGKQRLLHNWTFYRFLTSFRFIKLMLMFLFERKLMKRGALWKRNDSTLTIDCPILCALLWCSECSKIHSQIVENWQENWSNDDASGGCFASFSHYGVSTGHSRIA